tara:strand:- start:49 stop:264 length:216 start_codon:yes stop_codon:yes gene_type:complete
MTLIKPRSAALALSRALVSVSAHAQDLTISSGETYTNQNTMDVYGTLTNNDRLFNNYGDLLTKSGVTCIQH